MIQVAGRTLKATLWLTAACLFAATAVLAQSTPAEQERRAHVIAIAKDVRVAQSFKRGILAERAQAGVISAPAEAALAMDDWQLEELFADVLTPKLTLQEAREAHQFHRSPSGKALIAAQARDPLNPNPPLDLTPTQLAEVRAYMASPTGRKLGTLISSTDIWDEFSEQIILWLESRPDPGH